MAGAGTGTVAAPEPNRVPKPVRTPDRLPCPSQCGRRPAALARAATGRGAGAGTGTRSRPPSQCWRRARCGPRTAALPKPPHAGELVQAPGPAPGPRASAGAGPAAGPGPLPSRSRRRHRSWCRRQDPLQAPEPVLAPGPLRAPDRCPPEAAADIGAGAGAPELPRPSEVGQHQACPPFGPAREPAFGRVAGGRPNRARRPFPAVPRPLPLRVPEAGWNAGDRHPCGPRPG